MKNDANPCSVRSMQRKKRAWGLGGWLMLWTIIVVALALGSRWSEAESVDIINDTSSQLLVHCQSGDDDLGIIYMEQHGDYYFHFGQNIWGTTFFYCRFNWGGFTKVVAVWKGKSYVDRLDCEIEGQCVWQVNERGFSWAVKGPLQTFTFFTGWVRA